MRAVGVCFHWVSFARADTIGTAPVPGADNSNAKTKNICFSYLLYNLGTISLPIIAVLTSLYTAAAVYTQA